MIGEHRLPDLVLSGTPSRYTCPSHGPPAGSCHRSSCRGSTYRCTAGRSWSLQAHEPSSSPNLRSSRRGQTHRSQAWGSYKLIDLSSLCFLTGGCGAAYSQTFRFSLSSFAGNRFLHHVRERPTLVSMNPATIPIRDLQSGIVCLTLLNVCLKSMDRRKPSTSNPSQRLFLFRPHTQR